MLSSPLSSPTTTSSKRHSLNISTGPRPLHLVDGNVPLLSPPATAPLAQTLFSSGPSTPPTRSIKQARRQSSISYNPRDISARSPLSVGSRHSLSRSNSLGPKSSSPISTPGDRRSAGYDTNGTQERLPVTLAERHSELLHFIAQKESKCLELRSQLALHEAELLQLKRKWERIVSRGFEKTNSGGASSPDTTTQGSGAMLEGIREGVQGVSRFIAAGLSIGELATPTPSPSPISPRPVRRTHSTAPSSNSSISTSTTKSTRFSQSSSSSIGEELPPPHDDTVQVLMVHDTGATPTMSPNPAFMHKQQQLQEKQAELVQSTHSSFETAQDTFTTSSATGAAKIHRRKSRDVPSLPLQDLYLSHPNSPDEPPDKVDAAKAKRASLNSSAFPPVSSIPGFGSLMVGPSSPPMSSWVGSVGKRWEELQRGSTFSKNQKRASILLSDVSQSIVSALSPPPASISTSASSISSLPPPAYFSPVPASPMTASTTSTSLLDDDNYDGGFASSSIMTPDTKLKPVPKPTPRVQPSQPPPPKSRPKAQDDDDEWNW